MAGGSVADLVVHQVLQFPYFVVFVCLITVFTPVQAQIEGNETYLSYNQSDSQYLLLFYNILLGELLLPDTFRCSIIEDCCCHLNGIILNGNHFDITYKQLFQFLNAMRSYTTGGIIPFCWLLPVNEMVRCTYVIFHSSIDDIYNYRMVVSSKVKTF